MAVAFDCVVLPIAKGCYHVHPLKLPPSFDIFDFLPTKRASIFAHKAGVDPALIDIYAFFNRNLSNLL